MKDNPTLRPAFVVSDGFAVERPQPQFALVFHQFGSAQCSDTLNMIVTHHPMRLGKQQQPLMGAGQVFSHADVQRLRSLLADDRFESATAQVIPPAVLSVGAEHVMWWCRSRVAPMWFLLANQHYQFTVPWPHLLFAVVNNILYCAALATATRPSDDTPLYHAPLMNVYRNSEVCVGTADTPDTVTFDNRSDWQAAIYDTNFSHVNHDDTLQPRRRQQRNKINNEAHLQFWQTQDGKKRFPAQRLVSMNLTVGQFLARLNV